MLPVLGTIIIDDTHPQTMQTAGVVEYYNSVYESTALLQINGSISSESKRLEIEKKKKT